MALNKGITALANDYVKAMSQVGSGQPLSKSSRFALALGQPEIDFGPMPAFEGNEANPGLGSRLLDLLMRPLYGSANVAKGLIESAKEGGPSNPFEGISKSVEDFGRGFSGQDKTTYKDVINEALPEDWGSEYSPTAQAASLALKFSGTPLALAPQAGSPRELVSGVGGLAGDILLDPSNLIAGGVIKAVGKGVNAVKKTPTPVAPENGTVPIRQYWKEIAAPAKPQPDNAGLVQSKAIADEITQQAAEPVVPVLGNVERKTAEPVILDNAIMGKHLSEITSKRASAVDKANKARAKRPVWADEVNPDEYVASAQVAMDSTHLSPRDLSRITGLDYKTALRHIRLMEMDGILSPAAKVAGKNTAHEARSVATNKLPDQLMVNQTMPSVASRAAEMYDGVIPEMRARFDELASKGEKPRITASDGKEYTLSTVDIFEALPRQIVEDYNFGALGQKGASNLYPSQWHAGAAEALRMSELGAAVEPSVQAITSAMQKALRGNAARAKTIASSNALDTVARAMYENAPALAQKLVETNKKFGVKNLADAEAIAKTKADDIQTSMSEGSLSDAIDSVANVGNDISKMAGKVGATNDAAIGAIQQVGPMVAKVAPEVDIAAARNAKFAENVRKSEGFTPQADSKIMQRNGRLYILVERTADDIAREAGLDFLTIGEKPSLVMNSFLERLMHPLRNAFEFGYNTGGMAHTWRAGVGRAEHEGHVFRNTIASIAKNNSKESINAAYTALRRSVTPSDPAILKAYQELRSVYWHVLGGGLRGRLWRNGASIKAVNEALDEVGLKYRFKPPTKPGDRALVPDQVHGWDLKDPLSELEQINKAALLIETRQTVGVSASRLGSNVPKPGYVKLRAGEMSKLGEYVDTGLFYPREAAEYIQQLDVLIGSANNFHGQKGGIAWFANHIVDPIMQIWKPFMTVARPGHLTRNLWSDIIISALRGNMSVRSYRIAAKAMQAAGEYKTVSSVEKSLSGINKLRGEELVNGAATAFRYKGQPISYQGFYKMAHDEGLLLSWHSTEDILEKSSKFADKMLQNKYMQTMGRANEAEGQFVRLATFQHFLEKGKSVEEAGKLTRATHPDVKGLTPFEQKYMRRIFPFYSWFRQAMPVIFTTMLQKPGRFTGIFKAEYNAAVAMGVNPDSISDPFPQDKLYPSFIRDNIVGPIAGDMGVNLGTPAEALLGDTLNGSPARNIASMVNPLFTTPYEVSTRTSVGTGAGITDMSDYWDSKIPVVNQIANISGRSVTGLGDAQRQVAIGEKQHFFNTQMVNFLTGLGLMDTQKESYRNIAAKERGFG